MIKILRYGEVKNSEIFARVVPSVDVASIVADIIADVRRNGDRALLAYTAKFDKANLTSLAVTPEEIKEAVAKVEPRFLEILRRAAANIRRFHEKQVRQGFAIKDENGVVMGQ